MATTRRPRLLNKDILDILEGRLARPVLMMQTRASCIVVLTRSLDARITPRIEPDSPVSESGEGQRPFGSMANLTFKLITQPSRIRGEP